MDQRCSSENVFSTFREWTWKSNCVSLATSREDSFVANLNVLDLGAGGCG